MTVTRNHAGAWCVYGLGADGCFMQRTYYGYTKREAVAMWKGEAR